jgi:hypothetical protein
MSEALYGTNAPLADALKPTKQKPKQALLFWKKEAKNLPRFAPSLVSLPRVERAGMGATPTPQFSPSRNGETGLA